MIGEKVLWAGKECEVIDEDSDLEIVKISMLNSVDEVKYDNCIWVRSECVKNVYKENNNAK